MILVFDVGNTETTIGLFDGDHLAGHWRITTDVPRTPDEYGLLVRALVASVGDGRPLSGAAIGSVVPRATTPLADACTAWMRVNPVIIDARSPLPIRLDVDEPMTVGADRIINTLAASRLYARDAIVVDLGTATTFDCITGDGVFLGGVIAPGVATSAETLFRRTSKLPATELVPPKSVIGKRTEECVRAGVVLGAASAIDGLVRRIKAAWPRAEVPLVIATGGFAPSFRGLCEEFDLVEPTLTLRGLRLAYDHLTAATPRAPARGGN
ncbi:MAG TPA: type III pantothenate kinase [Gemmatimonadaceae bacterium]|nr:type III pantothenate kinase [Gemmatimonadaceae bacterium]